MERFVCNLHAYSAYLQYMEDTGRSKMRQEFWSFRGFRTEQIGLECASGFSHSIPHDNEMLIKQDGNLRKRHYTHIYMRCIYYIYVHACTCILDVSKRSVLGSADAYSVIFSDHVLFCWSWEWFSQIPQISAYSTYSKCDIAFFCISWQCLLFMERFVCNLHAYSAYLQYMEDTGRSKMR